MTLRSLLFLRSKSGGFCCQVPPEPRLTVLTERALKVVHQAALRSQASLSIVVVCNYKIWSGNGGTPPSKNQAFITHVDPISPPKLP